MIPFKTPFNSPKTPFLETKENLPYVKDFKKGTLGPLQTAFAGNQQVQQRQRKDEAVKGGR